MAYFFGPPCRYLHQTAEEFHQSSADEARQRLRSAFTSSLVVPRTRLSTIGDRALPVVPALLWSILLLNVTSISVFRKHMKTHHFSHSFPKSPVVPAQWRCHFGHYDRSFTYLHSCIRGRYVALTWPQLNRLSTRVGYILRDGTTKSVDPAPTKPTAIRMSANT